MSSYCHQQQKGQKGNVGSYILLGCLAGLIGLMIAYFLIGRKGLLKSVNKVVKTTEEKEADLDLILRETERR